MSIQDQDIMVLHRTIPNPMVIPDQAIATVHLHTIPNPMVIPGRAITAVPRHTIPSPMVIRGPVDKWWPVISPTKTSMVQTTRSLGGRWTEFRFRTGDDTSGTLSGSTSWAFEQLRTSSKAIELSMDWSRK